MNAIEFINGIIRDVAELPDRTSPDGDMMLVTGDELRQILTTRLENVGLEILIDEIEAERAHFKVLSDGPGRYALCDDRVDDLAPVFRTEAEALAEIDRRVSEGDRS